MSLATTAGASPHALACGLGNDAQPSTTSLTLQVGGAGDTVSCGVRVSLRLAVTTESVVVVRRGGDGGATRLGSATLLVGKITSQCCGCRWEDTACVWSGDATVLCAA
jgi:hypothetical protein